MPTKLANSHKPPAAQAAQDYRLLPSFRLPKISHFYPQSPPCSPSTPT
ncbi:hypothetical protein [Kingella oralis]